MPLDATIISTGEELVQGRIADTNAAFVASLLSRNGFEVRRIVALGDDPAALEAEIERGLDEVELVIVSGGLGPTADDRTRGAIARTVGRELVEDGETRQHVEERLRSFHHDATPDQLTQCHFPEGARIFPNPRGTARGFACCTDRGWVVAMPGVPPEMRSMFTGSVLPFLMEELAPAGAVSMETVHVFPASESRVDQRIRDLTVQGRNPAVGITVSDGVITVSVRGRAESQEEADRLVERDLEELRERFGDLVYGTGQTTLAGALSKELERTGRTVAVAESITGGLIGNMLVDVPGISRFFLLDVVAYSNEAKVSQLGVPPEVIEREGAVSEPVAEAMARGACRAGEADLGISTTGIAGPTGGTPQKPVGLVYVGLCLDGRALARKLNLRGDRWRIKDRAARHALNMARLALTKGMNSDAINPTM
ncbi:MAG: competence/damage-inducible protein A [Candidatus Brocadiia bacterium]